MAIILKFSVPPSVALNLLKKKIDDHEIDTWEYDEDGDFTHSALQWKNKAWFTHHIQENELVFGILGRKDTKLSLMEYSVYHGRFTELLMNHLAKYIMSFEITPPRISEFDTDEIEYGFE